MKLHIVHFDSSFELGIKGLPAGFTPAQHASCHCKRDVACQWMCSVELGLACQLQLLAVFGIPIACAGAARMPDIWERMVQLIPEGFRSWDEPIMAYCPPTYIA